MKTNQNHDNERTETYLWTHGTGTDLFPRHLSAVRMAQTQGVHGRLSLAGAAVHHEPAHLPTHRD